jgi:thymidylate kinase
MPIVAICGPDGVGKSTLTQSLVDALSGEPPVTVFYGGKKTNHHLPTTPAALFVLELMRRIPGVRRFAPAYQTVIFQPLEYLENRARWRAAHRLSEAGQVVVFDRFVIDRMWRCHVTAEGRVWVRTNAGDRFFHWLYDRHFPSPDAYLFLLPTPGVMFDRAPGEYTSLEQASAIRDAYDAVALHLESTGRRVCRMEFGGEESRESLAHRAIAELGI